MDITFFHPQLPSYSIRRHIYLLHIRLDTICVSATMNEPLHIDKGDVYLYLAAIDSASHPDRRVAVAVVFVWTGTGLRCDVHCVEVISSMLHPHGKYCPTEGIFFC